MVTVRARIPRVWDEEVELIVGDFYGREGIKGTVT